MPSLLAALPAQAPPPTRLNETVGAKFWQEV